MVDFIKIEVPNSEEYERVLLESGYLNFKRFVSVDGEYTNYPQTSKYENLEVRITRSKVVISGSLHKFYNMMTRKEEQNYTDFDRKELNEVIDLLIAEFKLRDFTHTITNMEFGLNLKVNFEPKRVIANSFIMFDYQEHSRLSQYDGKGYLKEFSMTDYLIKVYDKSSQYGIKDYFLIRIEIRYKRGRYLRSKKLYSIQDLKDTDVLKGFIDDFAEKVKRLKIIDYNRFVLPQGEVLASFDRWANPNTWKWYQTEKYTDKRIRTRKKNFEKLIEAYGLDKVRKYIFELIDCKFTELLY